MTDLIMTLTNAEFGTDTATFRLLTMASLLLVAVAQVFLARRNDLGWWVYLLGMFAGPVAIALYPGQASYWQLLGVAPQVLVGILGLVGFSRAPLRGRFTRRIENARFSVVALIGLLVFAFVTALLQFGRAITAPSVIFSEGAFILWLNFVGTALVAAGLLGVGFGARWAWLLSALGGLWLAGFTTAQPAMSGTEQPLFGLLLGYVLIFVTALYGLFAWGTPVPAPEVEPTADELDEAAAAARIEAEDAAAAGSADATDAAADATPAPGDATTATPTHGQDAAEAEPTASGTTDPQDAQRSR